MTAEASMLPSLAGRASAGASPWPVAAVVARQIRRGAVTVLLVAAGMSGMVAATYPSVMSDPGALESLRVVAANPAIRMLFGEPLALGQAGGFTVWRVGTVVSVLLGVWSILTVTRILRAEEESRRRDLLLGGCLPLHRVTAWSLAVVALVPIGTGLAVTAAMVVAGAGGDGAVIHGAGIGLLGLFFVAVAAVSAQIFATRASASGAAIALLGATLVTRMLGDGVAQVSWLRWVSPFGLLELSGPFAHNRPIPLLLLALSVPVLAGLALRLVGHRDVGQGLISRPVNRSARLGLLSTAEGFAVRRCLRPTVAWSVGVAAYFLLVGLTVTAMIDFVVENPDIADLAAAGGFSGLDSVKGFVAAVCPILAVPVGCLAAVRLSAFMTAESDRRLSLLVALPLPRGRLLLAEVLATALAMLAVVTCAALALWIGIATTGGGLSLLAALAGTWSVTPVALLGLGAAVAAYGWVPQATMLVGSVPVVGGFLLQVVAESTGAPSWVRQSSPFAHLAPVPLEGMNWTGGLVMVAVSGLLAAVGMVGYRRRDLLV